MRNIKDIMDKIPYAKHIADSIFETEVKVGKLKGHVVFSENENGWEHVSFAPYNGKIPSWNDMCELKDIFWEEEEEVVQIHPKKSEYINISHNCLHLWRKDGMLTPKLF